MEWDIVYVVCVFNFEVEMEPFFFMVGAADEHMFGALYIKSAGAVRRCRKLDSVHMLF